MTLARTVVRAPTTMARLRLLQALLLLCVLQSASAHAQRAVRFGIEGGAALTNFAGGDLTDNDWRTSPWIGISVVADRPGAVVGLQSGLHLISKGPAFNTDAAVVAVRLRYLEVPLLLRLGPARPASRVRPVLLVGGAVGVRIGCSVKAEANGRSSSLDCDDAYFGSQTDIQRVDAGLSVGGEVGIPYRKNLIIAPMVRYTHGLINIASDGTDDYNSKNTAFQIGLGLRFR
ncbi:MAG: PorT family protein [Gemmatimonadaceae bacterium]|nr:PorT family protein [Gemmatimonadaceae bacterium]